MRIALATVGTTGDVAPFALLARRLVERGHEVTAVTWPVHRAALAQPGVRVEVAGPHADPARIATVAADAASRSALDQVRVLRDYHLADGEAHYRQLREILPGHDAVLIHGIHSLAHAVALDTGLRWASVVFDPVLLPTATAPPPGMPNLGPANGLGWWMLDRMIGRVGRPLHEVLRHAGSAQQGLSLFRARSDWLHVVACSPSIVPVPADLPASTHVTGAWLERGPSAALGAEIEAFLADGAPPIVITFGSMAGTPATTVGATVERLLQAGRRVVLQGRATGLPASPNLLATTGKHDHRALFPRAAAVVHHGGAGTTHAACAAGVPSVVVPHVGDQRYWGVRLHRLGVAPEPQPVGTLRADRLADAALTAATDRAMRDAARMLAERIAAEDGLGETVRLLERASHA